MLWFADGEMTNLLNVDTKMIRDYQVHSDENNGLTHT